jgi:hypothetical protein
LDSSNYFFLTVCKLIKIIWLLRRIQDPKDFLSVMKRLREREREREKGQERRDLESWRFLQRIRVRFWVCGINCRNGFVDQFQVARIEARDLGFRIEEIQNTRNPR